MGMGHAPSDASPIYKEGWNDGCETGLAAYGNDIYKAMYKFKQDPEKMRDRSYYRAWNDALNYCRSYVNRYLTDGLLDLEPFSAYDLRNRKVIEGPGMGLGVNQINTPGWYGDPYAGGIPGFNQNYFEGGEGDLFRMGPGSSDWLGRDESTDWLGRDAEHSPGDFGL